MPPSMIGTAAGVAGEDTANILQNQRVINMDDTIHDLDPQATSLTSLLMKLRKEETFSHKIEWMEDEFAPKDVTSAGALGTGNFSVAAGNGVYIRPFDILHVPETMETMLVLTVSTDALTLTRSWGATAATTTAGAATLRIIGNAMQQGDNMPAMRTTKPTAGSTFTQIFREPVGVVRTAQKSRMYGGPLLDRLRKKHGIQHMMDIERAFWFGEKNEDTSGTHPRTTTDGVMPILLAAASGAASADGSASALTEDGLETWAQSLFRYGNKTKFVFCSRLALTRISAFARAKLNYFPEDQTLGIQIGTYQSPHGVMKLVENNLFEGTSTDKRWSGWMVGLDLADVSYQYLTDSDTKLLLNRQANDVDGVIDEYLTECGMKLVHARHHGYFKNFT